MLQNQKTCTVIAGSFPVFPTQVVNTRAFFYFRVQNLTRELAASRQDHERLLHTFQTRQTAVRDLQRYSSCSVQLSTDSSVTVPPIDSREDYPTMTAVADFSGTSDGELSFRQWDRLQILEISDDAWWLAKDSTGEIGHVPASYMQEGLVTGK